MRITFSKTCDHLLNASAENLIVTLCLLGNCLMAAGMSLVGPSSLLASLWPSSDLVFAGTFVEGIGMATGYMALYSRSIHAVRKMGYAGGHSASLILISEGGVGGSFFLPAECYTYSSPFKL